MFVRIDNSPRPYAWGSSTQIARLFGRPPSGGPEAELWLGAHPGSPSRILDPAEVGGAATLADWVAGDPEATLGVGAASATEPAARLPFLLKVLAAARPLSLQAHPTTAQARAGFARENDAGVPLAAAERNYKDPYHKPELIFALSDTFDALCGFRAPARAAADVRQLIAAADGDDQHLRMFDARLQADAEVPRLLRGVVGWLLGGGDDVGRLVGEAGRAAPRAAGESASLATVGVLADAYPGDPGVVLSLLLNRVTLARGQALYLPAGNIHAYLSGLGIEIMAASDNVLRGGLTPKHVDVPELLRVLDFAPVPVPYLPAHALGPGIEEFRPPVPDFRLVHVDADGLVGPIAMDGPAIVLCTRGSLGIGGRGAGIPLLPGEAAFVTPDEGELTVSGQGTLFLAAANRAASAAL